MKIIGLTRIRNEADIIQDTLDHMATFCDEVYIYDDASTDNTVEICENHSIVKGIIKGDIWDVNRERAEYQNREAVLVLARNEGDLSPDDWFIYMDADERIEFEFTDLKTNPHKIDAIKFRLFDFYITEEDINLGYNERKWMGPEYRDILFMFKNKNAIGYWVPDQREVFLMPSTRVMTAGYVKHYGKSISVQQWEDTCEYYSKTFPKYAKKWEARKGKAIHTVSDFNRPLIEWSEKEDKNKIIKI